MCVSSKFTPTIETFCRANDEIWFLISLFDQHVGSYGTVYKGQNTSTGEYVAMKRIHTDLSDDGFPQSYLR